MIFSDECWMRDSCKLFLEDDTCECKSSNIYCEKLFRINSLYDYALLSELQKKPVYLKVDKVDFEAYNKLNEIQKQIVKFVDEGRNLYIHSSNVGNGKTTWSLKLLKAYLDRIWFRSSMRCRALFINVPRFLLTLKDSISVQSDYIDYIKQNVLDADLVVWDEVAIKSLTAYEHEQLLNLINTRIDNGKSNIYTSNLYGQDLLDRVGDRLYSRIVGLSECIEFKGVDKRGRK